MAEIQLINTRKNRNQPYPTSFVLQGQVLEGKMLLLLLDARPGGEIVVVDIFRVAKDESRAARPRRDDRWRRRRCGGRPLLRRPLVEAPVARESDVAAPTRRLETARVVERTHHRRVVVRLRPRRPRHHALMRERDGGHCRVGGRRGHRVRGESPRSADGQRAARNQHHGHGRTKPLLVAAHRPPLSTPVT